MNLTEHFTLDEFADSQTAARLGLDNTPSEEVIANLRGLCDTILEPARQALGPLRISSGYRAPAVNAAVGGSKGSAHMLGFAADVIPVEVSKLTFARWVKQWVPFDQVIGEYGVPGAGPEGQPAWIHVSCGPALRAETLRVVADGRGYRLWDLT